MTDLIAGLVSPTPGPEDGIALPMPFDGGEGDGGGGAGGTPPADGSSATLPDSDKPSDGSGDGDKGGDGGDKPADGDSDGDKPKDGDESGKGRSKTDQDSEALALTAPEGFEDYQAEFDRFAAEMDPWLKANPDATPKDILAEAARRQAQLVTEQATADAEAFNSQLAAWEAEAKADKEIGGANYEANVAVAVRAIETFGNQALKDVLNQSGLGNHPELIRFAVKAGAQLKEAPVLKGAGAAENMSLADALYNREKP